jgi:hypothetical protein
MIIFVWMLNQLLAPKYKTVEEVDYLQKKDFGKVPDYLGQVKTEIEGENLQKQTEEDARNKPATRLLSERVQTDVAPN